MINTNFKMKSKEIKRYARELNKETLPSAMRVILDMVGNTAVADYMVDNQQGASREKLSIRRGRLAGSIVGAFRFSQSNLPPGVKNITPDKYRSSTKGFEGGKKESIRKINTSGKNISGTIGSKVPYAAIQEKGGKTKPKVTTKSRRYFWFAYMQTGDDKWKAMALSQKDYFKVSIPPRPYLSPAAKDSMPKIKDVFRASIEGTFDV